MPLCKFFCNIKRTRTNVTVGAVSKQRGHDVGFQRSIVLLSFRRTYSGILNLRYVDVDNAYDPVYGARPLKRYIQKYVETATAKLILSDGVDSGDTVLIDVADGALKASVKRQ